MIKIYTFEEKKFMVYQTIKSLFRKSKKHKKAESNSILNDQYLSNDES